MTTISFSKVQATGADFFVYTDLTGTLELSDEQIAWICDRSVGIGASGVIRVVPSKLVDGYGKEALKEEPNAKWLLDQRTPDGKAVELSGNGTRAFVRYLIDRKLHEMVDRRETIAIATRGGIRDALIGVSGISVDLGRWRYIDEQTLLLGRQHWVKFASEEEPASDRRNLTLIRPREGEQPDGIGQLQITSYGESGQELVSSGTGAIAAAIVARQAQGRGSTHHWRIETAGGPLGVRLFPTQEGEHVSINGAAEIVYSGEVTLST